MAITGIAPGASGTFTASPVNSLGAPATLPAGVIPVWTASDATVVLTPSADGLSCAVAVPGADTGTSFTLTATATMPDKTTPTGTGAVPILALEVASFVINQTA